VVARVDGSQVEEYAQGGLGFLGWTADSMAFVYTDFGRRTTLLGRLGQPVEDISDRWQTAQVGGIPLHLLALGGKLVAPPQVAGYTLCDWWVEP
jgi:hypothetical protein